MCKVDGVVGVPLERGVAVWREVDHFDSWFPGCHSSRQVEAFNMADRSLYLAMGNIPGLLSDAFLRCWATSLLGSQGGGEEEGGENTIKNNNNNNNNNNEEEEAEKKKKKKKNTSGESDEQQEGILIVGRSVTEEETKKSTDPLELDNTVLKYEPKASNVNRLAITKLKIFLQPKAREKVRICLVISVALGFWLPQWLLSLVFRVTLGVILSSCEDATRRVTRAIESGDPGSDPRAAAIEKDKEFYTDFLLPRLESFYERKGWGGK